MKTYSRLQTGRRRPSEYEIVSTGLQYNYPSKFEMSASNPVVRWYHDNREGSDLQVGDWTAFGDPRATTYRVYTRLQNEREVLIEGLYDEIDRTGYDDELDEGWVRFLHENYFPLRYPLHGLQMLAAYVGQMAPSSRLINCATFQAGDELRRLQRIAYRTAQLDAHRPGYDIAEHRCRWEDDQRFQPLRELVERALTRYDWGEAFVLLNVVIKPRVDRWINQELAGTLGNLNGDPLLRSIHFSLAQDSDWHREWTAAALRVALSQAPANGQTIEKWVGEWRGLAELAVGTLAIASTSAPNAVSPASVIGRIRTAAEADLESVLG